MKREEKNLYKYKWDCIEDLFNLNLTEIFLGKIIRVLQMVITCGKFCCLSCQENNHLCRYNY